MLVLPPRFGALSIQNIQTRYGPIRGQKIGIELYRRGEMRKGADIRRVQGLGNGYIGVHYLPKQEEGNEAYR
jgi:hypothetical protein